MARPLRIEYPGAFYHVTSRGETAIVEASRRFSLKMGEDKKLKGMVERVKRKLKI